MLSKFLYDHREHQLYSEKVHMMFVVEERQQKTDVYWFEVARSALLLSNQTMLNVVHTLRIIEATSQKEGYAHIATSLELPVLGEALAALKATIGVCHYTLKVAAQQCKFLQHCAPQLMTELSKCYHSFRVMGCFVQGLRQLHLLQAQEVANWMDTAEAIASTHETVAAAVSHITQCTAVIKLHAFAHKALRDGQRGIAVGFARAAALSSKATNPICVQHLATDTAMPHNAAAHPVPPPDSTLLRIRTTIYGALTVLQVPSFWLRTGSGSRLLRNRSVPVPVPLIIDSISSDGLR